MNERLVLAMLTALYDIKNSVSTSLNPEFKDIHNKIRRHVAEQNKNWNKPKYPCYQGYERIKWHGMRNTERRMENYGLYKHLKKDWRVLDIGCNMGFVSLEAARFVKSVDGLDINPYLMGVAKDTADFLGIKNANFFTTEFEKFHADNKYDAIFSFANHETGDGLTASSIEGYFKKVCECLKQDGLVFFESHNIDHENWAELNKALTKFFDQMEEKTLPKENALMKGRVFRVLKKKG